jgi:hypothetical protein
MKKVAGERIGDPQQDGASPSSRILGTSRFGFGFQRRGAFPRARIAVGAAGARGSPTATTDPFQNILLGGLVLESAQTGFAATPRATRCDRGAVDTGDAPQLDERTLDEERRPLPPIEMTCSLHHPGERCAVVEAAPRRGHRRRAAPVTRPRRGRRGRPIRALGAHLSVSPCDSNTFHNSMIQKWGAGRAQSAVLPVSIRPRDRAAAGLHPRPCSAHRCRRVRHLER